jgi:hypothetical protein
MPCIVAIYSFMIKSNREFALRQTAIQQWYEFFERLNLLMQDYTIDYEEYFNRQMVWCSKNAPDFGTWENFKRNTWTWWYCTEFTAYWNRNSTNRQNTMTSTISPSYHDIYDCSSQWENPGKKDIPRTVKESDCWKIWSRQSFGQYKSLFIDVNKIGPKDDEKDLWKPVNDTINAIVDPDNIKELYLISHDWKKRLYFRRKLINQEWNSVQYKIQMLRLKWFDAGQDHNFESQSEWFYDWQIDTWACDTSMWFIWHWPSVWWGYSGYYLPDNKDDCWVDLTYWSTSIYTWNLFISPLNDPELYWMDEDHQINPYMKIFLVNWIYSPIAYSGSSITEFKIPIATAINMKDFYRE